MKIVLVLVEFVLVILAYILSFNGHTEASLLCCAAAWTIVVVLWRWDIVNSKDQEILDFLKVMCEKETGKVTHEITDNQLESYICFNYSKITLVRKMNLIGRWEFARFRIWVGAQYRKPQIMM